MTDITRFKAIFSGLDIAYGTYGSSRHAVTGKQAGKAVVVRKPPTDDLWQKHLEGFDPSLGIIQSGRITPASGAVLTLTSIHWTRRSSHKDPLTGAAASCLPQ
jgi:hypothetical protein